MKDHLFEVVVRAGSSDLFIAEAVGFPDLKAEGTTKTEAIQKVREALAEFLASSKQIKVALKSDNPWLNLLGHSANQPDFDEYLDEIRKARLTEDRS